jgi:rubredoxin
MMRANARRVVSKSGLLRSFPELRALSDALSSGMNSGHPKFHDLPDDCSCLGEGPAPVSRVPRVGAMPELITYQCPACGHVETIEETQRRPAAGRF